MKDKISELPDSRLLQPQSGGFELTLPSSGFYEPRQNEEMSLGLILASLRRYWYVSIMVSTLMMAAIVYKTGKEPRIYKSGIQIAIELKETASLADKIAASTGSTSTPAISDDRTTTIETIIQILKSKTLIQKSIDLIADRELKPSADRVVKDITILPGQNSNILTINYTDTSPQRIVAILNALSTTYIDYSIKTKKARTDNSILFVESQLPQSRKRLELSSKQLEQFRQKYKFSDPQTSATSLATYRQEIASKLNDIRVQYNQNEQQSKELKEQLKAVGLKSDNVLSTTMLTQDSAYQELFKKLNELELAYSQEKVRFTEDNPLVITAKEKRDEVLLLLKNRAQQMLKREVPANELTNGGISNFSNSLAQNLANKQSEVETSLVSLTAQYQSLQKVYERVEKEVSQLPALQKEYTELQRQYTLESQELTAFLQKLQELKIAGAEQVIPWKLLDPPEFPRAPISPDVPRQLGLGALASLLAGVIVAVALNKLDNRIEDPNAVKSMTGMPILSLIPYVDGLDTDSSSHRRNFLFKRSRFKHNSKHSNTSYWSFVEAIRTLALGIGVTSDREENQIGKVIGFTSALPKEGKSTITFYTAITLAELGYRVLLVDVDLHKSTIAKLCKRSELFQSVDLSSDAGLSDVLLHGSKYEDLIKTCPQLQLEVLFSGPQSVNSISLLNSSRFKRLIAQWKQKYDYIIFDTPPIVGVSDTRLIGTLIDGLIYVVSLNVAQRQTINRATEIISLMQTPVLGLAVNRVENKYSGYSKYHDYYNSKFNNLPEQSTATKTLEGQHQEIEL
jgi:polysaccharide biosynthesis transport protein